MIIPSSLFTPPCPFPARCTVSVHVLALHGVGATPTAAGGDGVEDATASVPPATTDKSRIDINKRLIGVPFRQSRGALERRAHGFDPDSSRDLTPPQPWIEHASSRRPGRTDYTGALTKFSRRGGFAITRSMVRPSSARWTRGEASAICS